MSARRDSELPHSLSTERLLFFGAVCLGLLFLVWLRLHQPSNTVDDAYITYRYARNIATGVGFVYNAGERVLGTTTPAYAVLMALLSRLAGYADYPRLSLMTNTLIDALVFCLALRLTRRLTGYRWVGLGASLLYALEGRALDFSTSGMEFELSTPSPSCSPWCCSWRTATAGRPWRPGWPCWCGRTA